MLQKVGEQSEVQASSVHHQFQSTTLLYYEAMLLLQMQYAV